MKFNREHLEEETLQKIKEVNDEAGYRKYLEVPEMVEIVASIIEKQVNPHDGSTLDSFLLEEAELKIKNLEEELEKWKACADNLIDYAHEYVAHLSSWGKGYDRVDKEIKQAEDIIEEYLKLKNEK